MKPRAPLIIALAAGLPVAAPAQEAFYVSYSWSEVIAGTTTPVAAPNSVIRPGEGALIQLSVQARINGTNAVGQTTAFTTPFPGGIGTVRGLGSVVYDLVGEHNGAFANGTWSNLSGPVSGSPFTNGLSGGTPQPGGRSVHGFGGAQVVAPGQTVNAANTNVQVFRGVWTPSTYHLTNISFFARASILVPTGEQNSLLFAYGLGTGPTGANYDLLAGKFIPTAFGLGVDIIFIPAPASGAALLVGAALAASRRRSPG